MTDFTIRLDGQPMRVSLGANAELIAQQVAIATNAATEAATSAASANPAFSGLRNIAFDGALQNGGRNALFSGSRTPVISAAHADLAGYGIVNAVAIGNTGTGSLFKNDLIEDGSNGKYLLVGMYVRSAASAGDATDWPGTTLTRALYDAASGGSTVGGSTIGTNTFVQLSANVRLYYMVIQLPTTGTVKRIAYGFASSASGSVAQMGGFIQSLSEVQPTLANVPQKDWKGFTARDSWRSNTDASFARAGIGPYMNRVPNPTLSDARALPEWHNAVVIQDAPAELAARGIEKVRTINSADGAGNAFLKVPLDAAGGQYVSGEAYLYKADGDFASVAPPTFTVTPYRTTGASAGLLSSTTGFEQVSPTLRRYFKTGQINPSNNDYEHMRIGFAAVAAAYKEGGYELIVASNPVDRTRRIVDLWYSEAPTAVTVASLRQQGQTLAGRVFPYGGDSKVEFYGKPEALAELTGATIINMGFGGTTVARDPAPTGDAVYKDEFCGLAITEAMLSGDWSAQVTAAAALNTSSGGATDWRARVTELSAIDFSQVDGFIADWSTNDPNRGIALGSPGDAVDTTYYGAVDAMIANLQALFGVNIPFGFVTSGYRGDGGEAAQAPYRAAMLERCALAGVPCVDMRLRAGIRPDNEATFLSNDLLHLDPPGARREASVVAGMIRRNFV